VNAYRENAASGAMERREQRLSKAALAHLPTLERVVVSDMRGRRGVRAQSIAVIAARLGLTVEEVQALARRGLALINEA
jgi:DNA-directed RNA polymerase specialized sigma24 family protein